MLTNTDFHGTKPCGGWPAPRPRQRATSRSSTGCADHPQPACSHAPRPSACSCTAGPGKGLGGGGGRENTKPECSSEKTYIQCHTVKRRELGKFRIKSQLQTNYNLKTYFTEAKGKNMFKDTIKINHLPKGTEICGMRSYMTTVTLQK